MLALLPCLQDPILPDAYVSGVSSINIIANSFSANNEPQVQHRQTPPDAQPTQATRPSQDLHEAGCNQAAQLLQSWGEGAICEQNPLLVWMIHQLLVCKQQNTQAVGWIITQLSNFYEVTQQCGDQPIMPFIEQLCRTLGIELDENEQQPLQEECQPIPQADPNSEILSVLSTALERFQTQQVESQTKENERINKLKRVIAGQAAQQAAQQEHVLKEQQAGQREMFKSFTTLLQTMQQKSGLTGRPSGPAEATGRLLSPATPPGPPDSATSSSFDINKDNPPAPALSHFCHTGPSIKPVHPQLRQEPVVAATWAIVEEPLPPIIPIHSKAPLPTPLASPCPQLTASPMNIGSSSTRPGRCGLDLSSDDSSEDEQDPIQPAKPPVSCQSPTRRLNFKELVHNPLVQTMDHNKLSRPRPLSISLTQAIDPVTRSIGQHCVQATPVENLVIEPWGPAMRRVKEFEAAAEVRAAKLRELLDLGLTQRALLLDELRHITLFGDHRGFRQKCCHIERQKIKDRAERLLEEIRRDEQPFGLGLLTLTMPRGYFERLVFGDFF
ncbi:hypothetical protein NM208_g6839 [Fusarium decemcellulare]|uniref:Uncharacterized protein n=1 Tax=Fusarium decemcellulare TaxID=57161 RepID=A0ACC1SBH5_9HYPO|nr:hypothetical protein NM208_g6839 [Fusarium decemcellulare]